jgi:hypothetical protein
MRLHGDRGAEWLDHVFYPDTGSPEYLAARAAFDERQRARRARLLAHLGRERGEELTL